MIWLIGEWISISLSHSLLLHVCTVYLPGDRDTLLNEFSKWILKEIDIVYIFFFVLLCCVLYFVVLPLLLFWRWMGLVVRASCCYLLSAFYFICTVVCIPVYARSSLHRSSRDTRRQHCNGIFEYNIECANAGVPVTLLCIVCVSVYVCVRK